MKNIEKLIFNRLVARRPVGLPEVGALYVEYRPAEIVDGKIVNPYNSVRIVQDWPEGAESVIELIKETGVSGNDAENVYNTWLSEVRKDDRVVIDGAGIISNGQFQMTSNLDKLLNPDGNNVACKRGFSRSEKTWFVLIPIMVLILAVGWGFWWYNNAEKYKVEETVAVTEQLNSEEKNDQVVGDDDRTIDQEASAEQVKAAEVSESQTQKDQLQTGQAIYHVVGGVFSVPTNAEEYIKLFKTAYPDAICQKLAYKNGRFLISVYSSTNEAEAERHRRKLEKELSNPDMWVYKQSGK